MGLFNKKKKGEAVSEAPVGQAKVGKSKKKKDMMSSILNESVVESALETMRSCAEIRVEHEGETKYIGLMLDANDPSIGGINKKSRRDESKGQVIELINSGRIATYIPQALLDEERLVIIPLMTTLDAMDEFGLLTQANYTIALTSDDGEVEDTEAPVTYDDMVSLVMNREDAGAFLAGHGVGADSSDYEDEVDDEPAAPQQSAGFNDSWGDASDDFDDDFDDDPFGSMADEPEDEPSYDDAGEDAPVYDEEPVYDEIPDEGFDDFEDEPAHVGEPVHDDADDGAYDEEEEAPAEEDLGAEIPEDILQESITRRFYSDALGLEVTTEPFDAQFLHANTYIPFDENRPEGWVNAYLNEMSKSANLEMKQVHQTNLLNAREMYYDLIAKHCEQIQHDLDETDPETMYGQLMASLQDTRIERDDNIAAEVAERRREIDEAWDKSLKSVAEDAARSAQQQYRDRYGKQHDEQVYNIEPSIRRKINEEYDDAVRDLHGKRMAEASKRLDYGITETLAEVSKLYMEKLAEERELYAKHRERINAFLDENRKDDIARTRALEAELAQSEKADKVMAEYEQKLKNRVVEFEAERQRLGAELESMDRRTKEQIAEVKASAVKREDELQAENDRLRGQVDDLLKQYRELDEKKEREYGARTKEARDERDAWADKCDHMMKMHRKSSAIAVTAAVLAVIASLAIGVIVGTNMNLDFGSKDASTAITQEFNERMDKLEEQQSLLEDKSDAKVEGEAQVGSPVQQDAPDAQPEQSQPAEQPAQ